MSTELLAKLKPLQHQRGDVSPFSTHAEFQTWSDNVLPLLAFNPTLQSQLKSAVHAAYINLVQEVPDGVLSNINRAIGIVNQAATSLEINPIPDAAGNPPTKPSNIEVKDWHEKPIGKTWLTIVGGVLTACAIYVLHSLGLIV